MLNRPMGHLRTRMIENGGAGAARRRAYGIAARAAEKSALHDEALLGQPRSPLLSATKDLLNIFFAVYSQELPMPRLWEALRATISCDGRGVQIAALGFRQPDLLSLKSHRR